MAAMATSALGASCSNCGLETGFQLPNKRGMVVRRTRQRMMCSAVMNKEKENKQAAPAAADDAEEVTRKFGLEAGLWKIFTSKDESGQGTKKIQAKELLTRYGGAYLATSISLSAVSFALCYLLINAGVDVPSLLAKVGIQSNETGEKVGTLALAYAAHKAASPIRFPPTVALTPIVASWFGNKSSSEQTSEKSEINEREA